MNIFGKFNKLMDNAIALEQGIAEARKLSGLSEKEIRNFIQTNIINVFELNRFLSVFGELPNKDECGFIYKSRTCILAKEKLKLHYAYGKRF